MNEQAAKLTRWLLAGNGALKNVAQLLTEAFGPVGAVAASIDASTITAYPVDPATEPEGQDWTRTEQGWTHPLRSQMLPRSISASHHVVAGITSRNEVLVINLAAAAYVGIEGGNPTLIMRSWLMQALSKTPAAVVAVTDPALALPGAERLHLVDDPQLIPEGTSLLLSTEHTSAPTPGEPNPIIVSSQAVDAANVVLCSEAVAGIYLANRYWPIWRRMEVADPQWQHLKGVLTPTAAAAPEDLNATPAVQGAASAGAEGILEQGPSTQPPDTALTSDDAMSPAPVATPMSPSADPHHNLLTSGNDTSPAPAPDEDPAPTFTAHTAEPGPAEPRQAIPADLKPTPQPTPETAPTSTNDTSPSVDGPAVPAATNPAAPSVPAPGAPLLVPDVPTPFADFTDDADDSRVDAIAALPGRPAEEPTEPGLYVLGPVYALGRDPETNEAVKHSAVTRQGVRKPVKALMALATSNGVTSTEWEEKILQVTPSNRRQLRTQIRKMMGGTDPIRNDTRGLLIVDMFCDWKEFNRLVGQTPESATIEALTAAVHLIRGAPFEDVPDEDYAWRSVQLLKDELIDRCSTAATELAQRQLAAGAHAAAYQTARLGLRVYAKREDLWLVAAGSVTDTERKALIWDLKQAIPVPTHPELRQLLAASRAS
ncbi:bacterial transcriptional activator domain-containing protein [Mycolicibacterium frederiksbergense]|uniref:bacterial transcriptional activator domain-containing protein n=1 Tax=Mycolicibacterium frederiksbergense TaxID=117567 RepID=UPI0039999332